VVLVVSKGWHEGLAASLALTLNTCTRQLGTASKPYISICPSLADFYAFMCTAHIICCHFKHGVCCVLANLVFTVVPCHLNACIDTASWAPSAWGVTCGVNVEKMCTALGRVHLVVICADGCLCLSVTAVHALADLP
jgi:hypothetical protein